jgi:hypothetical protein
LPLKTALNFPQLTIKGMGGFLEGIFETLYNSGSKTNFGIDTILKPVLLTLTWLAKIWDAYSAAIGRN